MATSTPRTVELATESQRSEGLQLQLWAWAVLGSVLTGAAGHLLIKFGVTTAAGSNTAARAYLNWPLLAGLSMHLMGTMFWVFAVSKKEISYLYPMSALTYAIVALGGQILFHESISLGRWLGIAVVVAGVVLLQFSARSGGAN